MKKKAQLLETVGTVHDELITIVDDDRAEEGLKVIQKIMSTPPAWAPGFPLKCEAKIMERYGK
jgi:DNA polymerase I-like protein with 3'-5' exonuclease and polymerase domains